MPRGRFVRANSESSEINSQSGKALLELAFGQWRASLLAGHTPGTSISSIESLRCRELL